MSSDSAQSGCGSQQTHAGSQHKRKLRDSPRLECHQTSAQRDRPSDDDVIRPDVDELLQRPRYYRGTQMPVAGWFHPCKLCRCWTATTLGPHADSGGALPVCRRCVQHSKGQVDALLATVAAPAPRAAAPQARATPLSPDGLQQAPLARAPARAGPAQRAAAASAAVSLMKQQQYQAIATAAAAAAAAAAPAAPGLAAPQHPWYLQLSTGAAASSASNSPFCPAPGAAALLAGGTPGWAGGGGSGCGAAPGSNNSNSCASTDECWARPSSSGAPRLKHRRYSDAGGGAVSHLAPAHAAQAGQASFIARQQQAAIAALAAAGPGSAGCAPFDMRRVVCSLTEGGAVAGASVQRLPPPQQQAHAQAQQQRPLLMPAFPAAMPMAMPGMLPMGPLAFWPGCAPAFVHGAPFGALAAAAPAPGGVYPVMPGFAAEQAVFGTAPPHPGG